MKRFSEFVVKFRYLFFGAFAAMLIASFIMLPHVASNYDIADYLPDDMETRQALTVIEKEFGLNSFVSVMVKGVSVGDANAIADELREAETIKLVTFDAGSSAHYKDGCALIKLTTVGDDYSQSTKSAVAAAEEILRSHGFTFYMSGSAVNGTRMQEAIGKEMLPIMLISVAIVIAILLLSSRSWFEPVIFLIVVGVAILINLGTNLVFGEISYITKSVAAILQLALAMDYSIVLLHNFDLFVEKGEKANDAAAHALAVSVKPIVSSSLTTVAGLVALMFMSFGIGFDIGMVMSKGIIISMLTVFFLMPGLLVLFHKPLKRLSHRPVPLGGPQLAKGAIKGRFVLPVLLIALIATGAALQSFNTYSFEEVNESEDQAQIQAVFGQPESTMIIVVPKAQSGEDYDKQEEVVKAISALHKGDEVPFVSAQTYRSTMASLPPIMQIFGQGQIDALFNGTEHSRIILSLDLHDADDAAFAYLDGIKGILNEEYGENNTLMAGGVMTNYDISKAFGGDLLITNLISIIAILLIIGLTFRSFSLPAVLVLIIQGAIWIAMSLSYIVSQPIFFMSYLIASAILMGATIDYAILITEHYTSARKTMGKRDALIHALDNSIATVLTSGLILTLAGFIVGGISSSLAVSTIGMLLGRGALAAMILVLVLLPELLYLLDKVIEKTSIKMKFAPAYPLPAPETVIHEENAREESAEGKDAETQQESGE